MEKKEKINAQTYLETTYPRFLQKNIKKLTLRDLNLEGELDLSNFDKLEELDCSNNSITYLNVSGCINLRKLKADSNGKLKIILNKNIEENLRKGIKKERRKGLVNFPAMNWSSIHFGFDNRLTEKWISSDFTYQQAKDWISIGLTPEDYDFTSWIRDVKNLEAQEVLNHAKYEDLRREFFCWQQAKLQKEIEENYLNMISN